jgi:hypothetical protein
MSVLTKVRSFINQSPQHKILWQVIRDTMMERRRQDMKMDVYRLRLRVVKEHGHHFSNDEFNDIFERFATMGLGKFKRVRTPDHSTFTWAYSARDLSQALLLPTSDSVTNVKETSAMPARPSGGRQVVFFVQGRPLPLSLPEWLTEADYVALADQLRALGRG